MYRTVKMWGGTGMRKVRGKLIRDTGSGLIIEDRWGIIHFAPYRHVMGEVVTPPLRRAPVPPRLPHLEHWPRDVTPPRRRRAGPARPTRPALRGPRLPRLPPAARRVIDAPRRPGRPRAPLPRRPFQHGDAAGTAALPQRQRGHRVRGGPRAVVAHHRAVARAHGRWGGSGGATGSSRSTGVRSCGTPTSGAGRCSRSSPSGCRATRSGWRGRCRRA